ncbi:MAG: methyl-accepting chemotaxis protein [Solirubrobacteraceae bacterium]|jgi:methyl-accepting chemotaxis protein
MAVEAAGGTVGLSAAENRAARTAPASGASRALHWCAAAVLAGYAVSLIVRGPQGASYTWLDGWGVAGFELLVSLMIVARGVRHKADRRYAVLLGLGGVSWALGDFAMTYETLGGHSAATLSAANFLWAGFFPLAYVGVMVLMRRDVRKLTAANYLDGIVATLATAAALVAFGFQAILAASGGSSEFVAINLFYPVADLLLAGLTIFAIALLPPGRRLRWYLIAAAGAINAAGDICALFNGLAATDVGWFLNAIAWPASLLLLSVAVCVAPDPRVPVKENTSAGFRVPAVASTLALTVLCVASLERGSQVAIGFATLTLVAAGARFVLALARLNAINDARRDELEAAALSERESKAALQAAVRSYAAFAARVAEGDLTATASAEARDLQELADSLNVMVGGLAEISTEIQRGVHDISSSTAEILGSVSTHTDGASRQSSAVAQATATVNDLRGAADQTSSRAREVAERAGESIRVSSEGTEAVAALAAAMHEIRTSASAVREELVTLSDRAQQIGLITETVNQIADRSRLLALNATIEAARAGEQGKGFAVVAEEVKDLAQQSRDATARVDAILGDVRQATRASVAASEASAEVVERGLDLTTRADEGIRKLAAIIHEAAAAAEQIATSAESQSLSMDQIAEAMAAISDDTVQFVAGARSSEAAAQRLNELSAKLSTLSERYRVATV